MTKYATHEYKRLRAKGWSAREALRAAKIADEWTDLENDGRVRMRCEPDDSADLSWADEQTIETANRDGAWGLIAEYRIGDRWEHADSCWGFVGDDIRDNGYDSDLKWSAIAEARKVEATFGA